jgi:hypothetical protein
MKLIYLFPKMFLEPALVASNDVLYLSRAMQRLLQHWHPQKWEQELGD